MRSLFVLLFAIGFASAVFASGWNLDSAELKSIKSFKKPSPASESEGELVKISQDSKPTSSLQSKPAAPTSLSQEPPISVTATPEPPTKTSKPAVKLQTSQLPQEPTNTQQEQKPINVDTLEKLRKSSPKTELSASKTEPEASSLPRDPKSSPIRPRRPIQDQPLVTELVGDLQDGAASADCGSRFQRSSCVHTGSAEAESSDAIVIEFSSSQSAELSVETPQTLPVYQCTSVQLPKLNVVRSSNFEVTGNSELLHREVLRRFYQASVHRQLSREIVSTDVIRQTLERSQNLTPMMINTVLDELSSFSTPIVNGFLCRTLIPAAQLLPYTARPASDFYSSLSKYFLSQSRSSDAIRSLQDSLTYAETDEQYLRILDIANSANLGLTQAVLKYADFLIRKDRTSDAIRLLSEELHRSPQNAQLSAALAKLTAI